MHFDRFVWITRTRKKKDQVHIPKKIQISRNVGRHVLFHLLDISALGWFWYISLPSGNPRSEILRGENSYIGTPIRGRGGRCVWGAIHKSICAAGCTSEEGCVGLANFLLLVEKIRYCSEIESSRTENIM